MVLSRINGKQIPRTSLPRILSTALLSASCEEQSLSLSLSPVGLGFFGAHVSVGGLLGDKDTTDLAQFLVHLEEPRLKSRCT